jgi:phenylalanyl-tRNA synthetase beta chain
VKRLETIGQRPINNVADITNYVLHEWANRCTRSTFTNSAAAHRRAARHAGEKLQTLDGVERTLPTTCSSSPMPKCRCARRNHGR